MTTSFCASPAPHEDTYVKVLRTGIEKSDETYLYKAFIIIIVLILLNCQLFRNKNSAFYSKFTSPALRASNTKHQIKKIVAHLTNLAMHTLS
jgi:hypothetical protein